MTMDSTIPVGVRKGAWTDEEDALLKTCIQKYGEGKWHLVPLRAGLNRCRKSCRLRWLNYLHPNIKRGTFAFDEVDLLIRLHKLLGNRWSLIAGRLPGRTANDVKNYWNTRLGKKNCPTQDHHVHVRDQIPIKSCPTESKIVKPQPRTFTKRISWLRQKTAITTPNILTAAINEKLEKPSPSLSSAPTTTLDDDITQWWDTLFANCQEDGGEIKSWSSLVSVSDEDSVLPRVDNEITLPDDMDIWGLLRPEYYGVELLNPTV